MFPPALCKFGQHTLLCTWRKLDPGDEVESSTAKTQMKQQQNRKPVGGASLNIFPLKIMIEV